MKQYVVFRKEIHQQAIHVMAESFAEAKQSASQGEGDEVGELEYCDTMDKSDWSVERGDTISFHARRVR